MLWSCFAGPTDGASSTPPTSNPRLAKELKRLMKKLPLGVESVKAVTGKENECWQVMITGPKDSPYEGGRFCLDVDFPDSYPFDPPELHFSTKIYHINVDPNSGEVCCSDFQWEAASTISHLLEATCAMIDVPDDSPCLVPSEYSKVDLPPEKEIIRLFHKDRNQYNKIARDWAELYAE